MHDMATKTPPIRSTKESSRDLPGFADALKRAMRTRGYTQVLLAEELGVTQSQVSTWVNGIYAPNPALIGDIERVLNQRPGTLTRFFGFLPAGTDDKPTDLASVVRADPGLNESQAEAIIALYEHFLLTE